MLRRNLSIVFDTDVVIPFRIYDGDGLTDEELEAAILAGTAPLKDITGWDLSFTVRKKENSAATLIYKTSSGSPGGIAIAGGFGGSPEQTIEVQIDDTDTYDPDVSPAVEIKPGSYVYALKRIDAGAETVLDYGRIDVTRTGGWE
jgi:hypothetical protein